MSEEDAFFCGHVTMAARMMRIYGRINEIGQMFEFEWFDPMCKKNWTCEQSDSKSGALINGCKSLVNSLAIT